MGPYVLRASKVARPRTGRAQVLVMSGISEAGSHGPLGTTSPPWWPGASPLRAEVWGAEAPWLLSLSMNPSFH